VIDIEKKAMLLFDSLPPNLSKCHCSITNDFNSWKQDDNTSWGIHCALWAQYYVNFNQAPTDQESEY